MKFNKYLIKFLLKNFLPFIFIFFSIIISNVYCEQISSDSSEIFINSDNLTWNRLKNEAYFKGEVILYFEDIILKTSELKILYQNINGANKINKIIIPTKLIAHNEKEQKTLLAGSAVYYLPENKLVLINKVVIEYQNKILTANKLIYFNRLKKVKQE